MVSSMTGAQIARLPNPRQESDENEMVVRNDHFLALGLNPTTLDDQLLDEVRATVERYQDRVDLTKIISRSVWRKGMETVEDLTGLPEFLGE